ncbi:MAG TPA: AarF/UbiB family protein [Microthrixaceae bacterium]|nr:AarF/UbiB family protein [Microthrixaceae bacterium]
MDAAINAPPPAGIELHPVELRRSSPLHLERRLRQTVQAFGPRLGPLLVRRGLGREVPDATLARQVRRAFSALGATYVKLGQVVASAPGVFGPEIAEEFRSLLDAGRPVEIDRIRDVIERETGQPLHATFSSFDPDPIGCASIAVVHRAVLRDGRAVAVKVTRPGIRSRISADLDIMELVLPRLAARLAGGDAALVGPMLEGLREQLGEELDLRNEARTMTYFRAMLAREGRFERIVIPEVVPECSGARVLVMELLDGMAIDDLSAAESFGFDPAPLVQEVVKAWFLMALRDGAFHGDMHAGNMLLLADGRVGALDWGILGRLTPETHDHFRSIIAAALGDEEAWKRVTDRVQEQLGPVLEERLGIAIDDIPDMVRGVLEPLLTRPFGEVQLSALIAGPEAQDGAGLGFVRAGAPSDGGAELPEFDRGMFLLGKQLLYFERYGKMYLSDVSLVSDRAFFESLVAPGETAQGHAPPDHAPPEVDPPS